MWKPPSDQVVTDTGWRPPSDAVDSSQQQSQAPQQDTGSFPEARAALNSDRPIWNSLQVPSQMASRGLNAIAGAVPNPEPTGNLPMDLIKGIPRIAANTIAQAAPGFINRASILTAGASKVASAAAPLAGAVGSGLASQLESLSGAKPGSVSAAFNDASTMFSKSKKVIGKLYNESGASGLTPDEELAASPIFGGETMNNPTIVDKALESANKGTLSPREAFEARKAADALKGSRSVNQTILMKARAVFDKIAKTEDVIAETDPQFKKAVYGESLRQILPQNKYGGTSAFKLALMEALRRTGGNAALALMSPAAVGLGATGAGLASRSLGSIATNPGAAVASKEALAAFIDKFTTKDNQ